MIKIKKQSLQLLALGNNENPLLGKSMKNLTRNGIHFLVK